MNPFDIVQVYSTLRRNAFQVMTAYRSDWRHDRRALRNARDKRARAEIHHIEFIHVATHSGTHLWFVEVDNLDTPVKILFGRATPREHMRNIADIFSPTSMSMPDGAIIQHFDGRSVKVIDRAAARRIFLDAFATPLQSGEVTDGI